MITPIEVRLEKAGSTYTRDVDDRFASGFRTEGRNKVTDYSQDLWQLSAIVQPPVPYRLKENTGYWK